MSEPTPFSPPPSPWNPATPAARTGPGCSKPLLVGCGVLLVLLGVGAVLFLVKMPTIVQWWFTKLEVTLEPRFPEDVTAAERARFHSAFEAARRALASGTVDASRMQPFQSKLLEIGGSEKRMTHDQLRQLSEALERLAGPVPAPSPPSAPRPAAAPAPSPSGAVT